MCAPESVRNDISINEPVRMSVEPQRGLKEVDIRRDAEETEVPRVNPRGGTKCNAEASASAPGAAHAHPHVSTLKNFCPAVFPPLPCGGGGSG